MNDENWIDETTGLPCLAKSNIIPFYGSFWCGYVGVKDDHPFFNKHYNDLPGDIQVHGGITFSDYWNEKDIWWIGFDCAHYDDRVNPKGIEFIKEQCALLAKQIMEASENA